MTTPPSLMGVLCFLVRSKVAFGKTAPAACHPQSGHSRFPLRGAFA